MGWGVELGCLRLNFERFEELDISQTFKLQSNFFEIEYFSLQFFRMTTRDVTKRKKSRKCKFVLFSRFKMHDLCITTFL